jgi:TolB-like protein/Flp pilus assembly protein TadD
MDDSIDTAHSLLGSVYLVKLQFEKAVEEAERAVALNPNGAQGIIVLAGILGHAGRWEESVSYAKKSIRLDPVPDIFKLFILGRAQFMTGHYDESIAAWKKALQKNSDYLPAHAFLAACYSSSGRDVEATAEMKEVLRIDPKFNVESHAKLLPYKNKADIEREVNALRKAGLPEKPSASIPLSAEVAPTEKVTPPSPEKVTKPAPPPPPKEEVASKEKMAFPLPDKPSIAVLPFVNMSDDKSQEFFSDGLTEEIITALSKTPKLFVIARNSTFVYKGKPVNVQQVSRELGVKYVLEGSVRRSGDQLRITAQLIDAITGNHLWAERYDRELKDIFAMQDEITMKILTSLQVSLADGEMGRTQAKGTNNLDAYLLFLQGQGEARRMNKDGNFISRQMAQQAIALDPKYALAYSLLANSYMSEVVLGISEDPQLSLKKAMELVQKAIALDNSLALPHGLLGWIYTLMRQHDKGIVECEQAVKLEPNSALAYFRLNLALRFAGRPKESITACKEAIRLDPIPVSLYYQSLTHSYCLTGQYEEAIAAGKKATSLGPDNLVAHAFLAAAYALHGREEEARIEAAEVLRINPKLSVDSWVKTMPFKNEADRELTIGALRKAGLK